MSQLSNLDLSPVRTAGNQNLIKEFRANLLSNSDLQGFPSLTTSQRSVSSTKVEHAFGTTPGIKSQFVDVAFEMKVSNDYSPTS